MGGVLKYKDAAKICLFGNLLKLYEPFYDSEDAEFFIEVYGYFLSNNAFKEAAQYSDEVTHVTMARADKAIQYFF